MKSYKYLLILLALFIFSCDCGNIINTIKGSGDKKSESRDLPSFTTLQLDGSLDVIISSGERYNCIIEGDDNIVPLVITTVKNQRLHISVEKSYSTKHKLVIHLEVPEIKDIILNGSGDINLKDVTNENLSLVISGSGDITVTGKVKNLTGVIDGSGDLTLSNLEADFVIITIDGSGDAQVWANKSLKATINGSGDIIYSGNPPNVQSKVNGSGDITKN